MKTPTFSRRIGNRAEYDVAAARLLALLESGPHPEGSDAFEERAFLSLLTRDYADRTTTPPPVAKSHEILQFILEQNGFSQSDPVPLIGDKSTVSLVLSGRRRLTPAACRRLRERFRVDFPAIVGKEIMETGPVRKRARRKIAKRKVAR